MTAISCERKIRFHLCELCFQSNTGFWFLRFWLQQNPTKPDQLDQIRIKYCNFSLIYVFTMCTYIAIFRYYSCCLIIQTGRFTTSTRNTFDTTDPEWGRKLHIFVKDSCHLRDTAVCHLIII